MAGKLTHLTKAWPELPHLGCLSSTPIARVPALMGLAWSSPLVGPVRLTGAARGQVEVARRVRCALAPYELFIGVEQAPAYSRPPPRLKRLELAQDKPTENIDCQDFHCVCLIAYEWP